MFSIFFSLLCPLLADARLSQGHHPRSNHTQLGERGLGLYTSTCVRLDADFNYDVAKGNSFMTTRVAAGTCLCADTQTTVLPPSTSVQIVTEGGLTVSGKAAVQISDAVCPPLLSSPMGVDRKDQKQGHVYWPGSPVQLWCSDRYLPQYRLDDWLTRILTRRWWMLSTM